MGRARPGRKTRSREPSPITWNARLTPSGVLAYRVVGRSSIRPSLAWRRDGCSGNCARRVRRALQLAPPPPLSQPACPVRTRYASTSRRRQLRKATKNRLFGRPHPRVSDGRVSWTDGFSAPTRTLGVPAPTTARSGGRLLSDLVTDLHRARSRGHLCANGPRGSVENSHLGHSLSMTASSVHEPPLGRQASAAYVGHLSPKRRRHKPMSIDTLFVYCGVYTETNDALAD